MAKVMESFMASDQEEMLNEGRMKDLLDWLENSLIKKGYILSLIAFLLGRAEILAKFTPFALPFFAAVFLLKREQSFYVLLALLAGALTLNWKEMVVVGLAAVLFVCLRRIYQPTFEKQATVTAGYVFLSFFVIRALERYLQNPLISVYSLFMVAVEAGLAYILTLLFVQCIPLFSFKSRPVALKTEEVVSVVIMLASMMSGTVNWQVFDVSLGNVLCRYFVLIFSAIGGASIGTTVGVVTGLLFSLANLSGFSELTLLAFSGLLGGLLREWKKFAVSIGLIIATVLIGLYAGGKENILITLYESGAAILLFLLTPNLFLSKLAKHVPGTKEYQNEQQLYVRKVRDVTAHRVNQFSDVFQALSNSFTHAEVKLQEQDETREIDLFLSHVTEKSCQHCFKKTQCWGNNFDTTYHKMQDLMHELSDSQGKMSNVTQMDWKKFCVKLDKVTDAMKHELSFYQANQKLKKQVQESRRIVADQLKGVSKVMEDFAKEIQKERKNLQVEENQIVNVLKTFGVEVQQVEIYSLEEGNIDIEMIVMDDSGLSIGEKLIAPMLSDILEEYVCLYSETAQGDIWKMVFRTAKKYVVEIGVANAAKDGGLISGDSFAMIDVGRGKQAIAISDGMGNGARAHAESTETLALLQKILESGIDEQVAIKSINSILSLRTTDEVFSTLDLAMIDLQDAKAKFLKIGSTPSFIRRGEDVRKVQGNNLPIGMIEDFDVDVIHEQLQEGDILVMMSDGILEAPKQIQNYEVWMSRKIRELKTTDPQAIADLILEEVIRTSAGSIDDDMTVVVALLKKNTPKWSNIPVDDRVLQSALQ